ncbi:MAG TPA: prepilin-type N-terminal cleavage/methylation domain-containing protein, partial [Verrucomicrobiae bacterium]
MEIRSSQFAVRNSAAFTLIELLVVISIIGVLAGLTIPVLASVKATQKKKVARGELEYLETALENYKAKYGAYPPSNQNGNYTLPVTNSLLPQLYYELSGT